MTVKRPTHDQLTQITQDLGMNLSDERISEFLEVMEDTMKVYDMVDAMPDYLPTVGLSKNAGLSTRTRRESTQCLVYKM